MKIYTKGGDKGKTGIHGGQRVDKDDPRIEANGTLDELNSVIGIVRSFLPPDHEWQHLLYRIQMEMMVAMSVVATPSAIRAQNPNRLSDDIVPFCEQQIDALHEEAGESKTFILPGGSVVSAHLHLARTVVRRAERLLWTLNRIDELPDDLMQFVNRLSDLFFVMSRVELLRQDFDEERWKDFRYKRKSKDSSEH